MQRAYYFYFQYSPIIPLVYGFYHFRSLSQPLKILLYWLSFSLSLTISMTILAKQGQNNLWLMNISLPVYTFLLLWMFSLWEQRSSAKLALKIFIAVFVCIWLMETTIGNSLFTFTIYSRPIMDVMIVAVGCFAIYEDSRTTESLLVERPRFWISSGLILYYGGTLFVNLLSRQLLQISNTAMQKALLIQPGLSLFSHLLYTIGLRCQCRK